jgi:hypothetical protein
MRVTLIVVLAVLLSAHVADASCGGFSSALSPPSGTRLPPHPTIYLFDADHIANIYDSLSITTDSGDELEQHVRATKLASTPDYTVHRIELPWISARTHSIRVAWNGEPLATYVIADDAEPDRARVVDVSHEERHWMCSFQDVIAISVEGNAIAYQIEWDDDRTTVLAGSGDPALLELGHPDCMSYNVAPELLGRARTFELYALFADGAVKRLGSSIAQLDERGARLPVELLRAPGVGLARRFSVAAPAASLLAFACAACAVPLGLLVWRRLRRSA